MTEARGVLSWLRMGPSCRATVLVYVVVLMQLGEVCADSADDWARMRSIQPKGYVCYRADEPLEIDGRLSDDSWTRAPWTDYFVDIEGNAKPAPRFRTRAKMLWDDHYFYIAAEMEEPHVWGTLTQHDSVIFHDNDFEVFIDPNGDNHEYYEFEINVLNTGWDLFLPKPYKDGGRADNGWEIPGLKTAIGIDGTLNDPSDEDQGWSVEIAIPWNALREFAHRPVPPREGDQWRVNFSRVEWQQQVEAGEYSKVPDTREDNWVWSPQGIIDMHRPERWGFVLFSQKAPGAAKFQLAPDWKFREALMAVYHHQRSFRRRHSRWAPSLDELKLDNLPGGLRLVTTDSGFRAECDVAAGGMRRCLHIRQDSKIWTSPVTTEITPQIVSILTRQAAAWNRGDIDAFMEDYWQSDDLTFSSGGKVTRGWKSTKENYKRRYPTPEAMGTLTFSELEVQPVADTAVLVLGRWHLERDTEPVGGNFSLVFRHVGGRWVIVHDHTSRDEESSE